MKKQINIRASDLTARQLDHLMRRWGTSQTETLTLVIDRIFRQETAMDTVQLIETNAGFLYIGTEDGPWFEAIGDPGTFDDDATAIANGDTDDWTVERFDEQPQGELVGEWSEGTLRVIVNEYSRQPAANIAARRYMGLATE